MPVPSDALGQQTEPIVHHVDRRWLMAYAAGLGDLDGTYLDHHGDAEVVGHPLFPVCVEWPTVLAVRRLRPLEERLTADEARRAVHATHDLRLARLVRAGDELTTVATVTGVERRRPGAFLTMELLTTDATGAEVSRTEQGTLYLGVDVDGPDRPAPAPAPEGPAPAGPDTGPAPDGAEAGQAPVTTVAVPIGRAAAHVYTECARIWNPIHTDVAVAHAAGLADIILHGTASLAHGVTCAAAHLAGGDPHRVRRISGRFRAMVRMPSTITVELHTGNRFVVRNEEGALAVEHGRVVLD